MAFQTAARDTPSVRLSSSPESSPGASFNKERIFSFIEITFLFAPEWRGMPPEAHSFLSCQKRMGRKEALENEMALTRLKNQFVTLCVLSLLRP